MTVKKTEYTYPKGGKLLIVLDPKTHKKIFDKANKDGRGVKPYIERLIEKEAKK